MLQGLLYKIRGLSAFPLFLEGLLEIVTLLMYYKQHRWQILSVIVTPRSKKEKGKEVEVV
jgi:hypothetical protein